MPENQERAEKLTDDLTIQVVKVIQSRTLHAVWERMKAEQVDPDAMKVVMQMARELHGAEGEW